ncbi:hypothetical protein V1514DRAFT_288875 [Lipomyces japonicus]|uniref:uncharacterized protein n=1 Tax=Lipomyces japonicus TaxID=56871 RepID=UPI0034CE553C
MEFLNTQQIESLQQFISITNWADNDIDGAVQMLEVSSWNLELAIARYYDEGPLRPNPHDPPRPPPTPPPPVAPRVTTPNPRTIVPVRPSVFTTTLTSIIVFPFTIVSKLAHGAFYVLAVLFPFLPRLTGLYPANMGAARSQRRSINPKDTASRFVREFEEEVGKTGVLPFFEGGYTQALDLAKKELRFLIVLLQSDEHDDTARFNKTVLAHPDVARFVTQHDIILWAGNVKESEAFQVANALTCTKYPFLAVIGYTAGTASHGSAMSIHARLQGFVTAPALLAHLTGILSRHEPVLATIRADRQEQESARAIRAAQDFAYEASLAADRERDRVRQEQDRIERERQARADQVERERQQALANRQDYRAWRAAELKAQLIDFNNSILTTTKNNNIARISIRLTSGDRIVARFFADSQTVEDVYAFIDVYDLLYPQTHQQFPASTTAQTLAASTSSLPSSSLSSLSKKLVNPAGYNHVYKFNLVSPMPRYVLPIDAEKLIKDEKTLWPNGNLIVEEIEEYDDDDQHEEDGS